MRRVAAILQEVTDHRVVVVTDLPVVRLRVRRLLVAGGHLVHRPAVTVRPVHHLVHRPAVTDRPVHHPAVTDRPVHHPEHHLVHRPAVTARPVHHPEHHLVHRPAVTVRPVHHLEHRPAVTVRPVHLPAAMVRPVHLPAAMVRPVHLPAAMVRPVHLPAAMVRPVHLPAATVRPVHRPAVMVRPVPTRRLRTARRRGLRTSAVLPAAGAPPPGGSAGFEATEAIAFGWAAVTKDFARRCGAARRRWFRLDASERRPRRYSRRRRGRADGVWFGRSDGAHADQRWWLVAELT